jgi:hypothetical protein
MLGKRKEKEMKLIMINRTTNKKIQNKLKNNLDNKEIIIEKEEE